MQLIVDSYVRAAAEPTAVLRFAIHNLTMEKRLALMTGAESIPVAVLVAIKLITKRVRVLPIISHRSVVSAYGALKLLSKHSCQFYLGQESYFSIIFFNSSISASSFSILADNAAKSWAVAGELVGRAKRSLHADW